jgi:hypothetical protein
VPEAQVPVPEGKSPEQVARPGQAVSLKVMEVDPIHHRILMAVTELGEMPPEEDTQPALDAVEAETSEADESAGPAEDASTGGESETTAPVAEAAREAEAAEGKEPDAAEETNAEKPTRDSTE